jgi:hypothetical protein
LKNILLTEKKIVMPDKTFEEQVREELSGLRIKPNDAVWETVAASLQQKRRRRWAIWLLTLLVGLSGASFWLWMEQSTQTSISAKSVQPDSFQQMMPQIDSSRIKEVIAGASKKTEEEILNHKNGTLKSQDRSGSSSTSIKVEVLTKPIKANTQKGFIQASVPVNNIVTSASSINTNPIQSTTPVSASPKDSGLIKHEVLGISEAASIGDLKYDTVSSVSIDTLKDTKKQTKVSKWMWRLAVQAGQSGIRNSLGSLFSGYRANSLSGFVINNPIPGSPTTGSGSLGSPSKLVMKDHFSFGVSFELMRAIGKKKKSNIGFQIGYDLYQASSRIGNTNTGTVQFSNVNRANESNVYYGVNDSANYISSYHFLRLGIQYYRSLNWIPKTNIRWYAGLGVNTLLSSNGLHLGIANNNVFYFRNRSLLQTTQLDMTSGIELALGKQKRFFVSPQAQYMLSNLSKQVGVNQHLFRPTIKVSWQLSKNQ